MILDKGKAIATGTKDELKAMITLGEKINVKPMTLFLRISFLNYANYPI